MQHNHWSRRHWLAAVSALGLARGAQAQADPTGGDPLGSMQWPGIRQSVVGRAPVRLAPEVLVRGPTFADDAMNVPVLIDARALAHVGGGIDHLLVLADRNPVRDILRFEPLRSLPVLAFRFKLEQASPLRVFVRTRDGAWHLGQTWIQASGGGCTVPGATRADGSWSRTLNQVQARVFNNVIDGSRRLRLRIMHPMDTGLVAGIPAFYIEHLELRDSADQPLWRMALHEPVSENPLLTFELPTQSGPVWRLTGRDNNGNPIDSEVRA
jgi:sulfur-oxidizing protein SoxY